MRILPGSSTWPALSCSHRSSRYPCLPVGALPLIFLVLSVPGINNLTSYFVDYIALASHKNINILNSSIHYLSNELINICMHHLPLQFSSWILNFSAEFSLETRKQLDISQLQHTWGKKFPLPLNGVCPHHLLLTGAIHS